MTIHCAVTFIDEENQDTGYLIGSDSNWTRDSPSQEMPNRDNPSFAEKTFMGKNYIGLFLGMAPATPILEKDLDEADRILKTSGEETLFRFFKRRNLSNLDNVFDDISNDVDYSNLSTIQRIKEERGIYSLLIATKRDSTLELFVVTNEPKALELKQDRAYSLHQIQDNPKTETQKFKYWFLGPGVPNVPSIISKGYVELETQKPVSLDSALGHMLEILQLKTENHRRLLVSYDDKYDPGPPNIYIVSFKRFGNIKMYIDQNGKSTNNRRSSR